ncbi:MAG: ParA family protein [Clostridia bacterium]|nr:ParA family protein [Clostridia bacterium]
MAKTIAIVNQKGGVGKTTTAVNLAAAVGSHGQRVLLVDIDQQGNATSGYGINKRELEQTSYDVIIGRAKASDVMIKTQYQNVTVLPSNMNIAGADLELIDMKHRESKLKEGLASVQDEFDYIFIDCPPAMGLITLNGLCASDTILVPIQCEYYALEGLSQLMQLVRQVKKLYNPSIDIEGVLLTMYDGRLNLTQQVVSEVKKFFPKKVFKSFIPRNVRLSEAPSFGQPIMYYDRVSKGSVAYNDLAEELMKNNGGKSDA